MGPFLRDSAGRIVVEASSSPPAYYRSGFPFSADGRLAVHADPVAAQVKWENGLPKIASGATAGRLAIILDTSVLPVYERGMPYIPGKPWGWAVAIGAGPLHVPVIRNGWPVSMDSGHEGRLVVTF